MSPNSVAVVDYGMGNLRSVAQAVMHAAQDTGVEVKITSNPQDVRDATRVVLPGQGAMPDCMRELRQSGLFEAVLDAAGKKPTVIRFCSNMACIIGFCVKAVYKIEIAAIGYVAPNRMLGSLM